MKHEAIPAETEALGRQALDAAFQVHSNLGPGLLESTYELCLSYELESHGIQVARQLPLPVIYQNRKLDSGYRVDLMLESKVVVEIKSVEALIPLHHAQLLTYLRLSGCRLGFLMNFNVIQLKDGLKRLVL
jgi:GxxExxY protein